MINKNKHNFSLKGSKSTFKDSIKKSKKTVSSKNKKRLIVGLSIAAIIPTVFPITYYVIAPYATNNNVSSDSKPNGDNSTNIPGNENGSGNENSSGGSSSNTNKLPSNINTSYFKNNLDPIDDGSYAFATYDSSDGKIIPSIGPSRTGPSNGVQSEVKLSEGKLYDNVDINQSKRTFALAFNSANGNITRGTGWILDYKTPENNEYPTTWYFATNVHVLQNLRVKDDKVSLTKYDSYNATKTICFTTIRSPEINKDYYNNYNRGDLYINEYVNAVNSDGTQNFKTIFMGTDFLKTTPGMYSDGAQWKNNQEYTDFAVMEVKFKDQEQAKIITANYANDKNNQFKYKKESLALNQSYQDNHTFRVLGYPALLPNLYYNAYTSLFLNVPKNSISNDSSKYRKLGTTPWYNTFYGKKGIFDAALGLSFFGFNYRISNDYMTPEEEIQHFCSWGLVYPIDCGNLGPGSSGSMMMDDDGYTWGIHFAADDRASTGLAQALYCEGFSYQGKFGNYNLEGYDLIEGGFPNQSKSYKDGLKDLYGSNFKTNLFPNGLN